VDRTGPAEFAISDVATELGVTRPTVYRYFQGTDELFQAVGQHAVEGFIDELEEHLRLITDPSDWIIEALATTIERVPRRPYLTLLLAAGRPEPFARGTTSPTAMGVGREVFKRARIDWIAAGYTSRDIDEVVELMLRLTQSMVVDPPDPPRSPKQLRTHLQRWLDLGAKPDAAG
jgi:AcrR family transcriptional regulator